MSCASDLDEYTDAALAEELRRRDAARRKGVCDYCGRPGEEPACRFPNRHAEAVRMKERPTVRIECDTCGKWCNVFADAVETWGGTCSRCADGN